MSVVAFVAAVQARDAAGARAALAPAFQGKANGKAMDRDAQVALLESFWAGFPDGAFTLEAVGGSGRHVITWTFKGTHGGLYLGVPPTGVPVTFSGFIIAVSDATGVTQLDWKWDTKVFTKAVLGPDDVGTLEVKDTFRDPSQRWAQGQRGQRGGGARQGKRGKKPGGGPAGPGRAPGQVPSAERKGDGGRGRQQPRQRKPREGAPSDGAPQGTPAASAPATAQDGAPAATQDASVAPEPVASAAPAEAPPAPREPDGT